MQPFAPILRTCSALLLATLVAACGGGGGFKSGEEAAREGDVLVRVVDARQATTPIANASVTVTSGSATRTGTTAADGTIRFSDLPTGSASVQVTRDLFLPFSGTVTVQGASLANVTAALQRRTGQVTATVVEDRFSDPVPNAQVTTTFEGFTISGTTSASGTVTLNGVPTGAVPVGTTADGFLAVPQQTVTVAEGAAAAVSFRLGRISQPGGGYTPVDPTPPTDNGQELQVRLRLVVVDADGNPIENLAAGSFTMLPCAPTDPARAECVSSPTDDTFDAPYQPLTSGPQGFAQLAAPAPVPYAAALLLDQSGSIPANDPTDARIFASKVFLDTVGANDRVVLAAFTTGSVIPVRPVTVYGSFTNDGASYFDELDVLATSEGGDTPLYQAVDQMLQYTSSNAPAGIPGQRKAIVVFTDGEDTVCNNPAACRDASIALSNNLGVDIFTVGLGSDVDTATLTELSHRGNGIHLNAETPEQMIAVYGSLSRLLSRNVVSYDVAWTIRASSTNVFTPGRAVLGTINVAHGTQTISLPFLYTVPAPPT